MRVTSDGGLLLVRELHERLGLSELIARHLTDPGGTNTQFSLADLVRQSVYRRLAGYEDVNDAQRLAHDLTVRLIGSEPVCTLGRPSCHRFRANEVRLALSSGSTRGRS